MDKTKNPIKYIYLTKVDKETLTFLTKRFNVIKECSGYVSLEDGIRIKTSDIYDVYIETGVYTGRSINYSLLHGYNVYTVKPISKAIKDDIKEQLTNRFKDDLEYDKKRLSNTEHEVEELKNKIAEKEAKLARLLKL